MAPMAWARTSCRLVMIPPSDFRWRFGAGGQSIGAGNIKRAARTGDLGAALSFGILSSWASSSLPSRPIWRPSSCRRSGVIAGASHFMRIMALAWGFMGVQLALNRVLRASGNMVAGMTITWCRNG